MIPFLISNFKPSIEVLAKCVSYVFNPVARSIYIFYFFLEECSLSEFLRHNIFIKHYRKNEGMLFCTLLSLCVATPQHRKHFWYVFFHDLKQKIELLMKDYLTKGV